MVTPTDVLNCPMGPNDAGAATIRGYLTQLLHQVWKYGEDFSGKRPFGNSGWSGEIEVALLTAGLVDGRFDEDGYLAEVDDAAVARLVRSAITAMGEAT